MSRVSYVMMQPGSEDEMCAAVREAVAGLVDEVCPLTLLHPLWLWAGYNRIEKPVRSIERLIKSAMFDCNMCGSCVLSQTGMSCPTEVA